MTEQPSSFTVDNVKLDIEQGEHGLYYGTSPDVKGLLITGKTRDEVIENAPNALLELKSARDIGIRQTTFPDDTIDWSPDNIAVKFP